MWRRLQKNFMGNENYFKLLEYRHSTRKYTEEQLSEEEIALLRLAANAAPVGSRMYQDVHLTFVQDRGILDQLAEAASIRWNDRQKMDKIWGGKYKPTDELEQKKYDPFHGAPTVIFVSHRKQTVQPGIEYANVAGIVFDMQMAATAMGLGSCYMWFALESMRELPEYDHTDLLALPEDFEPLMGLAVGHPYRPLEAREIKTDKISENFI